MTAVCYQPGDLVLTRSEGCVGALIRFGERVRVHGWRHALAHSAAWFVGAATPESSGDPCWVNHAAVYVGRGALIEALAGGLNRTPISKYPASRRVVVPLAKVHPAVTDDDRYSLVAFAETQLDRHDRYGWLSIASIVLQLLTPAKFDVSWDGALICSAFAAQCWEHAGVVLPTRSSLTTMPSDLALMGAA